MEYKPDDLLSRMKNREQLPNVLVAFGEEAYYISRINALLPDYVFGDAEEAERQITVFEKDTDFKELISVINSYPFFFR